MKFHNLILLSLIYVCQVNAQALLEANGPGNTYELINSVLAPTGGDVVENAECVHPEFGRHITEIWDATLNQYVFAFFIHVTPDNDRCINFDRQRVEIKTYDASPAGLKGTEGETVVYKWKFLVPAGFQPSSSFTHLHQIKAVGGDESDPIFVLTARKGSPNKLELNYYESSNLNSVKLTSVNLSLFEGNWVEVTERVKVSNTNGTYSIVIKNVKTSATILTYSNSNILTIRADNNFIRPKWGIYRSLNTPSDLRDEMVCFNSISIQEETNTAFQQQKMNENSDFSLRQNKVSDKLVIDLFSGSNNRQLQIINTKGQVIQTIFPEVRIPSSGRQEITVDISKLSKGIYFVRSMSANTTATSRFMII